MTHHEFKLKRETWPWWIAVLATATLFSTLLISPMLFQTVQAQPFATQPWSDPYEECPTPWAMRAASGADNMQRAFEGSDFPFRLLLVNKLLGNCGFGNERISYDHTEIQLFIRVEPAMLESPDSIGNLLAEALGIIQAVELEDAVPELDMLRVYFEAESGQVFPWSMNYAEGLRAADAGLSAEALFMLGSVAEEGSVPRYQGLLTPASSPETVMPEAVHSSVRNDPIASVAQFPEIVDALSLREGRLSPDGKWYVKSWSTNGAIEVISTLDSSLELNSQYNPTVGRYLSLVAWSPDSSALLVRAADDEAAGCPSARVVIYSIEYNMLRTMVYEPEERVSCLRAAWSPDGARIAVADSANPQTIRILDRDAQVIQQIVDGSRQLDTIDELQWIEGALFYYGRDFEDPQQVRFELHMVDPDNTDDRSVLFSDQDTTSRVVGVSPDYTHVLIARRILSSPPIDSFDLLVYGLDTHQVEMLIQAEGRNIVSAQSPELTALRMTTGEYSEPETSLWLFEWRTYAFTNFRRITELLHWDQSAQGFVVIQGDHPGEYWLAIISP